IPSPFDKFHAVDLVDWDGGIDSPQGHQLHNVLMHTLGGAYESQTAIRRSNVRESFTKSVEEKAAMLREAKALLVGNGGAGKTSLARRLFKLHGDNPMGRMLHKPFLENEAQTQGIDIGRLTCKSDAGPFRLNVWDFGGQEIMHSTHQFFFSRRSLYILVLDGRREDDPDYWLEMIQTYGGNSKVIIALNKIDENPSAEIGRKRLMETFPNVARFYRVSCKTGEGIEELSSAIVELGAQIDQLDTNWPDTWLKTKRAIEKLRKDFISYDEFEGLCEKAGVYDEEEIESLATYLNDLGVIVHFDGPVLGQTKVLNPSWATEGVYRILTSSLPRANGGVLGQSDLLGILDRSRFPRSRHGYLIELMRRFELCFPFGEDAWLIPDLLPLSEPDHEFDTTTGLRYKMEFDFLPTSVFPRTMINLNLDLEPDRAWRDGCIVADPTADARAMVRAKRRDRAIEVTVQGGDRVDYFSILRRSLIDVSTRPTPLSYRELVPCVCSQCSVSSEPHFYRYDILRLRREKGKTTVDCEKSIETVPLEALLGGISASEQSPAWDVFVSYSNRDTETVQKVVRDIRDRGLTVWWDSDEIKIGDSIMQTIESGLRKIRFLLPCISRHQVESGWCRVEYTSVFNRVVRGTSAQKITPLIIDDLEGDQIPAIFSDMMCARYTNRKTYGDLLTYVTGRS
ncbi:MAG: COR domain-containing protein, partial [Henriciella sp.]